MSKINKEKNCETLKLLCSTKYYWLLGTIIVGIVLTVVGQCCCENNDILFGIGTGVFGSSLVAFMIEFLNDIRSKQSSKDKKEELRNHILWGMPHGVLWIAKVIVEDYYPDKNVNNLSFSNAFSEAIKIMENLTYNDKNYIERSKERDKLLSNLNYGLDLCLRDAKSIVDHEFELEIENIFSKDELCNIRYLYEQVSRVSQFARLDEMAEHIQIFVEEISKIEEIALKFNKTIELKNGYMQNWAKIAL